MFIIFICLLIILLQFALAYKARSIECVIIALILSILIYLLDFTILRGFLLVFVIILLVLSIWSLITIIT